MPYNAINAIHHCFAVETTNWSIAFVEGPWKGKAAQTQRSNEITPIIFRIMM